MIRYNLYILFAEIHSGQASGEWEMIELDKNLLNASLRNGEFFFVSACWRFYGFVKSEQGEFAFAKAAQNKLHEIGETYDQDFSTLASLILKTFFLIMVRSAREAISVADEGISNAHEMGNLIYEIMLLGHKAEAQQLMGDSDGARNSLSQASILQKKQPVIPPYYFAPYLAAHLSVDIEQIKQAILLKSSEEVARLKKSAFKTGRAALGNVRNYALHRTKVFRLMGEYYWYTGKQRKAFKWWKKSIQEGERLGARPDLSRTYFEVGKRLLETNSKYMELNGIDAKGYLEKAAVLFEEMKLTRDLEELKAVRSSA